MFRRLRYWPREVLVAWAGFVLLLVLILASPHRLAYDEPPYLHSVDQLNAEGLGVPFLLHLSGHAGPLYTFVHYAAQPFTHLRPPWIRLINPLLFLMAVQLLNAHAGGRWFGMNLLGCPFIGMSIAMALTEMPAVFCVCASLLAFFHARENADFAPMGGVILGFLAGICFGLAILGRQTYAPILPFFVLLVGSRRQFGSFISFLLGAVLVFGPVFWIWGGPLPPGPQQATSGFSTEHAVLAFAYMGFGTLFLAPRFFIMPWRWFLAVAAVSILINSLFHLIAYSPAIGLTSRVLPYSAQPYLVFLFSAPLSVLAGATFAAGVRAGWKFQTDFTYLFYLAVSLALMFECAKMTLVFSSRYVVCVLPFWLFVLRPFFDTGKIKAARFGVAALINAIFPIAYWYL